MVNLEMAKASFSSFKYKSNLGKNVALFFFFKGRHKQVGYRLNGRGSSLRDRLEVAKSAENCSSLLSEEVTQMEKKELCHFKLKLCCNERRPIMREK